jgi:4a-hydroxytetrahydrobiopterin dehydratase
MELAEKHCVKVGRETPALSSSAIGEFLKEVPAWLLGEDKISRGLKFKNFREALGFVNRVGELSESEGHHPDILIHSWNRVQLTLQTDAIHALTENDFILAAKIERLLNQFG